MNIYDRWLNMFSVINAYWVHVLLQDAPLDSVAPNMDGVALGLPIVEVVANQDRASHCNLLMFLDHQIDSHLFFELLKIYYDLTIDYSFVPCPPMI
jgi:hypothetical protein